MTFGAKKCIISGVMVTLIFLRHGLSVTNNKGRFTGQIDAPLHERGEKQAQEVAKYFKSGAISVDRIYSSPSSRAYHTVLPTAAALNLPVECVDELKEINVGNWSGRTFEEIEKSEPEKFRLFRENVGLARYGDGESTGEAGERMVKAVKKIAEENEGKTVLISTHGGVLRALYCAWNGIPLDKLKEVKIVPNASISVARFENGKGQFTLLGFDEDLSEKTPYIPISKDMA